MTSEEFTYLKTPEAKQLIEQYLNEDIIKTALKIRNATLVTQIKNLQKCRSKLPSYYTARCIIPTVSYQQSSSEATARLRNETGKLAVDLTCGLGVDTLTLSYNFERVITVEIDPLRAAIARYNFELLGRKNIEVITSSAEEFINASGKEIVADLIYLDPSRRDEDGRSVYAIEECHPNVLIMKEQLQKHSKKTIVKLSPLFDVQQCYRLFGEDAACRVITVNNECKEVLIELSGNKKCDLTVITIRDSQTKEFEFNKEQIGLKTACDSSITPTYVCVPDVGFYKSRTIASLLRNQRYTFEGGYIFMEEVPNDFCGSVYRITEQMAYQPKQLRKKIKQAIVHLKDFPYTVEQIGVKQGGNIHLFFTVYGGEKCVFTADKI